MVVGVGEIDGDGIVLDGCRVKLGRIFPSPGGVAVEQGVNERVGRALQFLVAIAIEGDLDSGRKCPGG